MPEGEQLEILGQSGATLAIHLSIRQIRQVVRRLSPLYGGDCPVAVIYRASWPDELVITGTLTDIAEKVRETKITRTALILVGRVLAEQGFRGQPPLPRGSPAHPAAEGRRQRLKRLRIQAAIASGLGSSSASGSRGLAIMTTGRPSARAAAILP